MSKIQSQQMLAEAKAENMKVSHAQRTAQRQVQWELDQQRKAEEHDAASQRQMKEVQVDTAAKDLVVASQIRNDSRSTAAKTAMEQQSTGGEQSA